MKTIEKKQTTATNKATAIPSGVALRLERAAKSFGVSPEHLASLAIEHVLDRVEAGTLSLCEPPLD
jgi:hypothetical protein